MERAEKLAALLPPLSTYATPCTFLATTADSVSPLLSLPSYAWSSFIFLADELRNSRVSSRRVHSRPVGTQSVFGRGIIKILAEKELREKGESRCVRAIVPKEGVRGEFLLRNCVNRPFLRNTCLRGRVDPREHRGEETLCKL